MSIAHVINQNNWVPQTLGEEPNEREYQAWRNCVFEALFDAGYEDDGLFFVRCAGQVVSIPMYPKQPMTPDAAKVLYACSEDPEHEIRAVLPTCHLRICPDCAHREMARQIARYMPLIETMSTQAHESRQFRKITLTTPCSLWDEDISDKINFYWKAAVKAIRGSIAGGWVPKKDGKLIAWEFGPKGLRLHFHVFIYSDWIENRKGSDNTLAENWARLSGGVATNVFIQRIKPSRVKDELFEAIKYATKFWKRDSGGNIVYLEPEVVLRLHEVLKQKRRVRSYGVFYGFRSDNDRKPKCKVCSAEMERWPVEHWPVFLETGWSPSELNLKLGNKLARPPPESPPKTNEEAQKINQLPLVGIESAPIWDSW